MKLPPDYVDLLRALLHESAEFVVVGGWAVAAHGHGRTTDDLDILVRPSAENARRVYRALLAFGAPVRNHEVTPELFERAEYGYRMGRKPLLIEVLTKIDGVTFEDAAAAPLHVRIAELDVPFIGRRALLKNKRAAGRPKDLADVAVLEGPDDGGADG